jgi:hypothetical protein
VKKSPRIGDLILSDETPAGKILKFFHRQKRSDLPSPQREKSRLQSEERYTMRKKEREKTERRKNERQRQNEISTRWREREREKERAPDIFLGNELSHKTT